MINVILLGTSCMKPTRDRGQAGVYVEYKGEGLLFDCGEGTQRQLRMVDIKPAKISRIFISHWHGDHVLGLPGLIQTMETEGHPGPIRVYGPAGSKKFVENMKNSFYFDSKIGVEVEEMREGSVVEGNGYKVYSKKLEHGVPVLGFAFSESDRRRINTQFTKKIGLPDGPLLGKLQDGHDIEWKGKKIKVENATALVKGKKIVYITDTVSCQACFDLAKDADLLISEAVYSEGQVEKASEHGHMTAGQVGLIASKSGVKKLVMTHISQRHKEVGILQDEARAFFKNSTVGFDLMKIEV